MTTKHEEGTPASVTTDSPVAKFQIRLGYSPTMDDAKRIRRAINAAHGLPDGVPIGQRFPREVEVAQEKAGWGARTIEMSAWLTVAKDGTMQITLGDNDDGNNGTT